MLRDADRVVKLKVVNYIVPHEGDKVRFLDRAGCLPPRNICCDTTKIGARSAYELVDDAQACDA